MPWSRLFGPGRSVALTKQVAAWSPMSFRRNSAGSLPAVNHGRMAPQKSGREMEGKSLGGVQKGTRDAPLFRPLPRKPLEIIILCMACIGDAASA
jgi:hypothetical protein